MSTERPLRWTRKRRYAVATVVAAIAIGIAFYDAESNFNYKSSKEWNFDSYQNNTLPNIFQVTDPQMGLWLVTADTSSPSKPNVLAKMPGNNSTDYNMLIVTDSPAITDEEVSAKFMIVSGQNAQAAGLILRFEDKSHYFVLMADAMNDRFSLCKSANEYVICNYERQAHITTGQWHTIKAVVSSEGIGGYLDDKPIIKANNAYYLNGQIGFWTKKDTKAYFDDLQIKY